MDIKEDLKLDFCLDFNYPEELKILIREVVEALKREEVISIMTLGSMPRGEVSYRLKDGKLELFSDIEFMVVTKRKIPNKEQAVLIGGLKNLRKRFQPKNPLFDIAVEFITLEDIKRLPYKVRFYELKESGKTLFGQDLRNAIPKVNAQNLNEQDTNNIILRRLLSILLYFPRELFEDKRINFTQDVFKYILARNALDIATVLLFQRGIFFPTYRERVEYIATNPREFISDFGADFPRFLTRCLKVKLDTDFSQPLMDLFGDTLKYFKLLLAYTLEGMELVRLKRDIFGEKGIAQSKFEFLLKSPSLAMLEKRLRALSYSFLGYIVFFLLNMNESLCLFLQGDRRCLSVLDDSWWALLRLGILSGREDIPIDFVNRFLVLREKFFFEFYVLRFIAPGPSNHTKEILGWRYE